MVVFRQMAMWNGFACELSKLKRILKPTGSFVLDIKDKVVDGERHTYVLELVLALIKGKSVSGGSKNTSGTRSRLHLANGSIALGTHGSVFFISAKPKTSK